MKDKKAPVRMCIGCGEHKEKKELVRIVRNKEGDVFIDGTGKANGRGAYLCSKIECLNKSIKSNALFRNLGVKIDDEILEKLKESYGSE